MTAIRFLKDDKVKYASKQVLNFLRSDIRHVEEIHCEGTFTDKDVHELCQILLSNVAEVNVKVLYLGNNKLTIKSAESIAKVLYTNTTITALDLRHNEVGNEGVEALIQPLLSQNRTLKSLILKNNKLSHKISSKLGILLNRNNAFEELHLGHNEVGVKGMKSIAPSVYRGLQKLHLAHNHLKARGVQLLVSELQGRRHKLTFLDLTCNQIGTKGSTKGMHTLVDWLLVHNDTILKTLWVGSNDLGPSCGSLWSGILQYNSTLTEIRLGGNQLGDAGTQALAQGLGENHSLRVLELDWNQITDAGAIALAECLQKNGTLHTLDLSGNQIAQRGCVALAHSLPYHLELKELNMTNNLMNDEAARAFVSALTERHCVFEKLYWAQNNNITDEGNQSLEEAMQFRKNIKRWLNPRFVKQLKNNKVCCLNWMCKESIGDFEVKKLAGLLLDSKSNCRLTIMYLGGINITSKGIEALSEWIGSSSCPLVRLFIRDTSMGDQGASAIADALETNTSLRSLSLTSCGITAVGATSLGRALIENETLSRLSLAHNRIGVDGLIALASGIRESMTLTSLNAMSNHIEIPRSSDVWSLLVQTSIQELTLRANSIDDDIIVELAHALRNHCPFTKLDFIENQITEKGAWLLSRYLELENHNVDFQY
jgi:Ran GTPase-activating protein (RanGAP) involved in mRNA processing and transport